VLRISFLELQDPGIRLTQTLKENFQELKRHVGVRLEAVEKVVPPDLTHCLLDFFLRDADLLGESDQRRE
jgi:hypothetical protein